MCCSPSCSLGSVALVCGRGVHVWACVCVWFVMCAWACGVMCVMCVCGCGNVCVGVVCVCVWCVCCVVCVGLSLSVYICPTFRRACAATKLPIAHGKLPGSLLEVYKTYQGSFTETSRKFPSNFLGQKLS